VYFSRWIFFGIPKVDIMAIGIKHKGYSAVKCPDQEK